MAHWALRHMWGDFYFGKVLGTVLSDKSGCFRKEALAVAVSFGVPE